jgi:predicted ATPase
VPQVFGIRIQPGEHCAFIGCTGSGKTVLARALLSRMNRTVVIDPKHTYQADGFRRGWTVIPWQDDFHMIVRPKREEDWRLAGLIRRLWKRKNVTIFVDELGSLADFFPHATAELADVIRTGREKKVSVWTAIQRPAWVPRFFLSESYHKFVFTLLDKADRRRAVEIIGDTAEARLRLHDFLYHAPGLTEARKLTYNLASGALAPANGREGE